MLLSHAHFFMDYYSTQWEILAIFGSLQNPDFIQILGPKKGDFFGAKFFSTFSKGAKKGDFLHFGAKFFAHF